MDLGTLIVWTSGVLGAIFVLVVRHVVRPDPRPVPSPPSYRDWAPASFGLDLVVASFLAAPAAFLLRINIDDRLNSVSSLGSPEVQSRLERFLPNHQRRPLRGLPRASWLVSPGFVRI